MCIVQYQIFHRSPKPLRVQHVDHVRNGQTIIAGETEAFELLEVVERPAGYPGDSAGVEGELLDGGVGQPREMSSRQHATRCHQGAVDER